MVNDSTTPSVARAPGTASRPPSTVLRIGFERIAPALKVGRLGGVVLAALLGAAAAHANPVGPSVVHGSAHFARPDAGTLDVVNAPGTIINWQGFSIAPEELTRFTQPSASSTVLNRVVGADPSSILGRLRSNGRVFLVNPHGVVFGAQAVVDTAGLVASTLDIDDADFLAGRYRFDAGPEAGRVVNRGRIDAGAGGVFLLAPDVENSGLVRTEGGDLVLAAGRAVTLASPELDGVQVEVQAPEDEALNLGTLSAERGAVGMFAGSLRNAGTVEANAVTVDADGTIRLVASEDLTLEAGGRVAAEGPAGGEVHIESEQGTTWVSGEVSARASEGRGGTVRLLGARVGLDAAQVDASGPAGGGQVLMGGDVSGRGPVPAARATYVSADSVVSADALVDGDGGEVVAFAEGFANVRGHLSARGGPEGGAGGFVETSGLESFAITRTPDTTAPAGEGGHWLIDPDDIEIVEGGEITNIPEADPFVSTGNDAKLGIEFLLAALTGGQSVTVQTGGGGSQDGDIILNAALDIERTNGTNTLTLDAHEDILIEDEITDQPGGAELDLVLGAGDDVSIHHHVTLFGGSLRTAGAQVEIAEGATVTLDGDGVIWNMEGGPLFVSFDDDNVGIGLGAAVVRDGATIDAAENAIVVGDEAGGVGTLDIEDGGHVTARRVVIGAGAGSQGTVTVTGAGSTLTTTGTNNSIVVGDEGMGTLEVLDGGLVETLDFKVANSGIGEVLISGVTEDGGVDGDEARSRVIVSPANGGYTDRYAGEAGFARVARNAGSVGTLEIREGGLLRLRDGRVGGDGDETHGPQLQVARNKDSAGTVEIDGEGSSLEVVQNSPAVHGNPDVYAGPAAQLGRRGGATTIVRNGGTMQVRGESAFVQVSRDSIYERYPDPDPGPIHQSSVVHIESGGRMEVAGEQAVLVIGDSGPAADGGVTVTGAGSSLVLTGAGNRLVVGDDGGRGALERVDGATVRYGELIVGPAGIVTNLPAGEEPQEPEEQPAVQEEVHETTDRILPSRHETPVTEETRQEDEDEGEAEGEASGDMAERGEEKQEPLPMCPA